VLLDPECDDVDDEGLEELELEPLELAVCELELEFEFEPEVESPLHPATATATTQATIHKVRMSMVLSERWTFTTDRFASSRLRASNGPCR
jgi:hypothetical protein